MKFGDRIKQLRERKGMTQAEVGKIVGVSDRMLGYYENNERFPRKQEVIQNIAKLFDVSINYLVNPEDEFSLDASEMYGSIGHRQAQTILKEVNVLFAGGELEEDSKDEMFQIISELYFKAKKMNKEKYGHSKHIDD